MSNNIYDILNKLNSLTPSVVTEPAAKPDSKLRQALKESVLPLDATVTRLNERYQGIKERDLGKHNNANTGFAALAKKTGGGEKGARIAGAQLAKMRKSGKIKEEDTRPGENFTVDDLRKMEKLGDVERMKEFAKHLITTPSKKPMKPQKVAWFLRTIDSKQSPRDIIKLMYDLMLSGEGNAVIGSRSSIEPSKYRRSFGEEDASADPANKGEYDREGDMADSELRTAEDAAQELQSILDADDNLPEWVEAKISKAVDYLDTARDYMKSNPPEDENDHGSDVESSDDDENDMFEGQGMDEDLLMVKGPDGKKVPKFAADGKGKNDLKKGSKKDMKENFELETFVESAMAELEDLFITEKAKSKKQEKFFGKGDDTSKELKKAPKDMIKTDKTKNKDLPKHVAEGVNFSEVMKKHRQEMEECMEELNSHMEQFRNTGHMHDRLRDVMELHRHCKEKDSQDHVHVHNELDEIARLAGMTPSVDEGNQFSGARASALKTGQDSFSVDGKTYPVTGAGDQMDESTCNMTENSQYCPVHGMKECWSSGMFEDKVDEEYANEPDVKVAGVDAIVRQGEDLNRSKKQDPATANKAANPLGEGMLDLHSRMAKMYTRYEGK